MRSAYKDLPAYRTKDGSEIREMMHPKVQGNSNQSLAEAIVMPSQTTELHLHKTSEELYHISRGSGSMQLAEETFNVSPGDTVCIPANTPHRITNTSSHEKLVILCCCSPAYSHDDTYILD